jgi:CRISPR-associated protein Cse2 (CRISPR_cse2)
MKQTEEQGTGELRLVERMNNIIKSLDDTSPSYNSYSLSKGEKAELRRATLKYLLHTGESDFQIPLFKVAVQFDLPFFGGIRDEELTVSERWALWLYCAISSNHDKDNSFGKTLKEAGQSETRFSQLLKSTGQTFIKEMIAAIHLLQSKRTNLLDIGFIIFSKNEKAKQTRLKIAKDYFHNEKQLKSEDTSC